MTDAELVRLAADKVLGWGRVGSNYYADDVIVAGMAFNGREWNPLTSDAECWQIVDKLIPDFFVSVAWESLRGWTVWVGNSNMVRDWDRRRAIVLACLRAVGCDVT